MNAAPGTPRAAPGRSAASRPGASSPPLPACCAANHRDKALGAGCDDYHAKPVDFSGLVAQIDSALKLRAGADPAASS
ncbi:hypothetical protein [Belnapia moabensis]|uniref:hypothetical protein n=1 Tax=Belnapia moabensis TaxID=365533 RepID=UPI0009FDCE23|nr:hypothetical protein [Belnapia moabensis]